MKHSPKPITAGGKARTVAFVQRTFSAAQPVDVLIHAECQGDKLVRGIVWKVSLTIQ